MIPEIEKWHLLKHPFYLAWTEGRLTHAQLQNYAAQYYPHVEAFPRYVSAVHSLCEDATTRLDLARNLADEEGLPDEVAHPELWLRFSEGLGLTRGDVLGTSLQPAAAALREGFHALCRSSYAEGLGALIAYESQVPEIARAKIDGLKLHYGIEDERTLAFFLVHEEADVYHSDAFRGALSRLSPEEQNQARETAVQAARLLWDFLTETYAGSHDAP